ncbi:MAG: TlpA disulfide reductase family protein [Melioribacteraceae bacterium]
MTKIKIVLLFIFSFSLKSNGQYLDTIKITTTREKGFGPFNQDMTSMYPIDINDTLNLKYEKINGIPQNLKNLMFTTETTDYFQDFYQMYYSNKLNKDDFDEYKTRMYWDPTSKEYTKEIVKLRIGIVAGYDSLNNLVLKVDKNNNYDLSDENFFTLPKILLGQNYWGRYNDELPFEVEYEYYDGKKINKAKTWFFIDYSIDYYQKNQNVMNQIDLNYAFPQYNKGEFTIDGKKYFVATKSDRPLYRPEYYLKLWTDENESKISGFDNGIKKNGFVKVGDFYYRLDNISLDGTNVTLIKDNSVLERGGSAVGQKAINFKAKTINGKEIELEKLKEKVVLLIFWGTWCVPCREETPKLKSIFEQYKNEKFKMIGIANDMLENVLNYVSDNKIGWEQIVQMQDKTILKDFDVTNYPTTILIGKDGKIIEKNITPERIEYLLNNIFK